MAEKEAPGLGPVPGGHRASPRYRRTEPQGPCDGWIGIDEPSDPPGRRAARTSPGPRERS